MGTLFKQLPRASFAVDREDLDRFLAEASDVAKVHKVNVSDVVAAAHVLQLKRTNDLYAANGDAFDEQIGGIGELLERVAGALEGLPQQT